jgi:solute carrier family 25 (mitochondrial S-adenosylmethionine transporter), member 26
MGALCGPRFSPFCARPAAAGAEKKAATRGPLQRLLLTPLADGLNLAEHMVAGAAASGAATLAMHPLDTIKTSAQAAGVGAMVAARGRLRESGLMGLYRGVGASCGSQVPAGSVKLAAFEGVTQWLRRERPEWGAVSVELVSAAMAFVVCSVVLVPGEVVKQRLQAGIVKSGGKGVIRGIVEKEGVRGLYSGYAATLARDVPYTMLEFGLFAQFKRFGRRLLGRERLSVQEEWAIGGVAGGCTGWVTTPLDLAKTKLMTQVSGVRGVAGRGGGAVAAAEARAYKGVLDVFVRVAREEGAAGLFRGGLTRVAWLVPFTAVYFGVHGMSKRLLLERKQAAAVATPLALGKKERGRRRR